MEQNSLLIRLKNKLLRSSCPKVNEQFGEYFKEIADLLMNKCVIKKGSKQYELVEIEFYLFTPEHPDVITYPRDVEAGRWFFHSSGVDLTFESQSKSFFGGILIRGIKEMTENGKIIFGPIKCVEELWSNFNALEVTDSDYPVLAEKKDADADVIKVYSRWISVPQKKRVEKLTAWSKRIDSNIIENVSTEQFKDLVFDSKYRFIKSKVMKREFEAWKVYAAKPKQS